MDSAALFQRSIKENSDDLHEFLEDIKSWEDEIKKKDELLSKQKPILKKSLPPVRNKRTKSKQEKVKSGTESNDKKKPAKINSYDYRAWDKFVVEQACEDSDKEVSESSSECDEEDEGTGSGYTEEQKQQKAVIEKEKGNLLYSQHKYEAAIERYTQAITLNPMNAVLPANRAMALLKMDRFAAAEQDCSVALSIDPTYTKALFRRATARIKLNKLQDAAHDFNELLKYEPENKKAKAELVRISSMKTNEVHKDIEKDQQQQDEQCLVFPITRPPYMRSKKPLKRIHIEEIGLGTLPAMEKDPPATVNAISTDNTSSTQRELVDTVEVPAATTTSTVKSDTSTVHVIKTVLSTTEESPAKIKDDFTTVKGGSTAIKGAVKDDSTTVKGESTAVKHHANLSENTVASTVTFKPQLPPVPTSSITFLHDWKRLRAHQDLKLKYFQLLPVDKYSTILSQCLETDVFPDIIDILYNSYVKCGRPCIKELQALTRVQRFSVAVMFLSSRDKTTLCEIFSELKSLVGDEGKSLLQQLAKAYKVSL